MEDAHFISARGQDEETSASVYQQVWDKKRANTRPDNRIVLKAIEILDNLNRTFAHIEKAISVDIPELPNMVSDSCPDDKLARFLKHEEPHNNPNALYGAGNTLASNAKGVERYYRALHDYIHLTLPLITPALSTLLGPILAARLIKQAGSFEKLVKLPASTVQILGAHKAFRHARREHSNTPKHGLLFKSTWVQQASPKNRGKMARKLVAKCVIAANNDFFDPGKSTTPILYGTSCNLESTGAEGDARTTASVSDCMLVDAPAHGKSADEATGLKPGGQGVPERCITM
ncbi:hypothetical protein GGR57DRAFT_496267 [Xylariaceae sp. FL1272]|nr:hypothetical protein GGR57DRAFT_496267 [Xylariaceae sp. FL1272]